jgi:hypothetical protein
MDEPAETTEPSDGSETWVTLREAAEQASVSVSKVRGLYRAGRVRSRKPADWTHKEKSERRLVMVVLEDVLAQVGSARPVDDTPDTPPSSDVDGAPDGPPSGPPSSDVGAVPDTPPSSDVDGTPDGPPSNDVGAVPDTPPSNDVGGTPDEPPSNDVPAPSSTITIDRDLWLRLTARLEDIQRSYGELAAARERAAREQQYRDAVRKTLDELRLRVERLERQFAPVDSTGPSAGQGNSADDAPVPDPNVEVEWRVEEPEEPTEPSRFNLLRRRDHRS